MSLILQALKNAEAERALGQVPSAHATLVENDPPAPSRSAPGAAWWAAGLLLLVGLGAAGWWAYRATPTPTPSPPAPAAAGERSQPQANVPRPAAPPTASVAAAADATPAPVATRPSPAPAAVVATAQAPAPPPASTDRVAPPTPATTDPRTTTAPAAAPAPPSATEPPPLRLEDLPAAVRRTLPPLALGGVIHAERRADRMVILDGEVRREGELVAPDLVVERIEPRGVTLRHHGQALRLGF